MVYAWLCFHKAKSKEDENDNIEVQVKMRMIHMILSFSDVVGQVLEVKGSKLEDSNSNQKIVLVLLLQDNSTIRVTFWDNQASKFRQKFQQNDKECYVIVVTCLNPKMLAGKLHLNSSGSTKVYIDYNLEVVKAFMRRFRIELTVEAGDRTTTLVLFDKDAKKLLHTTSEYLIASNENEGEKNNINQIIG